MVVKNYTELVLSLSRWKFRLIRRACVLLKTANGVLNEIAESDVASHLGDKPV
jgi:hypothetical protein